MNTENLIEIKINILEKINFLPNLLVNDLTKHFTQTEIENIYILLNEDILTLNEDKILISKLGKTMLFCYNNANLILEFCENLDNYGYSSNFDLIMEFLSTQNLDSDPNEILAINNFYNFFLKKRKLLLRMMIIMLII